MEHACSTRGGRARSPLVARGLVAQELDGDEALVRAHAALVLRHAVRLRHVHLHTQRVTLGHFPSHSRRGRSGSVNSIVVQCTITMYEVLTVPKAPSASLEIIRRRWRGSSGTPPSRRRSAAPSPSALPLPLPLPLPPLYAHRMHVCIQLNQITGFHREGGTISKLSVIKLQVRFIRVYKTGVRRQNDNKQLISSHFIKCMLYSNRTEFTRPIVMKWRM